MLVALPEEAAALQRARRRTRGEPAFDLHVFGAGPVHAARALEGLNPSRVIHAGFAGGLRPDAAAGDLFVIRRARDTRGEVEIPASSAARAARSGGARPADIRTVAAPLDAPMKARLAAEGGADLVDMETAIVAREAQARGLDYCGLRIVSDTVTDEIPDCVTASWNGDRFRTGVILAGLLRRPTVLPELIALGRRARTLSAALATHVLAILDAPDEEDDR